MSIYWIVSNWHFSTTLTEVLSVLFPSVVRRMPGYKTQRRGLTLDMTNIMPPQKAYCLLTNGPQFVQFEVFKRGGKLVSVSATPFIVCHWAQRCGKRRYDKTDWGAATCAEAFTSSADWLVSQPLKGSRTLGPRARFEGQSTVCAGWLQLAAIMFRDTNAIVTQYRQCARAIYHRQWKWRALYRASQSHRIMSIMNSVFTSNILLHALLPNVAATMGCNVTFPILC